MTDLGGVLVTALSLVGGWIGLWPVRGQIGRVGYPVVSYMIGLLAWPLATSLLSLAGTGFRPLVPVVLLTAALFVVSTLVARGSREAPAEGRATRAWHLVVWGCAVIGLSLAVDVTGLTSAGYDSLFHYEAWGVWLSETGTLTAEVIGLYGVFIPSLHAASRYLGSDWTSVHYAVLSLHLAVLFAVAVREWSRRRVGAAASWLITLGSTALLVLTPRFFHHILYVHSHMITAAYLMLALFAIQRAYLGAGDVAAPPRADQRAAWLLVAGLASAGLALTRTDGIAYVAALLVVGTLAYLASDTPTRDHALFVGAAALPIGLVYGASFAALGVWQATKLSGRTAGLVLAGLGVAAGITLVIGRVPHVGAWLRSPGRALALLTGLEVTAVLGLATLDPDGFIESTANMVTNLFSTGGNGNLWFAAVAMVGLSLVWGSQFRAERWPLLLVAVIVQFMVIAVAVHGVGHPGRLSPADSFNRVSFHVIPLIFWYAATVVTSLVAELRRVREGTE